MGTAATAANPSTTLRSSPLLCPPPTGRDRLRRALSCAAPTPTSRHASGQRSGDRLSQSAPAQARQCGAACCYGCWRRSLSFVNGSLAAWTAPRARSPRFASVRLKPWGKPWGVILRWLLEWRLSVSLWNNWQEAPAVRRPLVAPLSDAASGRAGRRASLRTARDPMAGPDRDSGASR